MTFTQEDKKGIIIIIICAIFFISISVFAIIVNNNKLELDKKTLCPKNEPPKGHTVVLVDRTDPLAPNQTKWLLELIKNNVKANLSVHEKLSIIPITEESGKFLNPIFSLCSPRKGDNANPFYENPGKLRKKFELQFGAPLQKVLKNLRKGETYNESPIIESIKRLTEDTSFSNIAENRKIIIVSDMLQNTPFINHYKKYSTDIFNEPKYFKKFKPELNKTKVIIYYLANTYPKAREIQGERHKQFWKKYFEKSNVSGYSLITISKLDLKESATLIENIAKKKSTVDQDSLEPSQLDDADTFNEKGPSFNCMLAKTWDEKAICSNQELAQLDLVLSKVYHSKLIEIKTSDQQNIFAKHQLDWLKIRHLCYIEENKTECLKNKILSRIKWMKGFNVMPLSKTAGKKVVSENPLEDFEELKMEEVFEQQELAIKPLSNTEKMSEKKEPVIPKRNLLKELEKLAKIEPVIDEDFKLSFKVKENFKTQVTAKDKNKKNIDTYSKGESKSIPDVQAEYTGRVQEIIYRNWRDPLAERHSKKAVISFHIFPKGNIDKPFIKQSSGLESLDTLAVLAVLDSVPFPPFPQELKMPNLFLSIHFKYVPKDTENLSTSPFR